MSQIPCKECISYAICKPKREIQCDILDSYTDEYWENNDENFWNSLRTILPNLSVISKPRERTFFLHHDHPNTL